jgi:hypothetical protein
MKRKRMIWTDCASGSGGGSGGRAIEILDEDGFVALFVEEQFVDEFFGHEKTETAGTHAARLAFSHMTERIVRRIGERGMFKFLERKTLAWIFDAANDGTFGADVTDFYKLGGIEFAAVLHSIEKDFAKGGGDFLGFDVGKLRGFAIKLNETIGGENIATNGETKPIGSLGKDFDAVVPAGLG